MTFALYVGGALVFSAAAVLALGTAVQLEKNWRPLMVPALYLLILLLSSVFPLLGGREAFMTTGTYEPSSAAKWLQRLVILTMLTICVARLMGGAFARKDRQARGGILLGAFAVYFVTTVVLSSILGTYPAFNHDQYYVPFLFAAVYASRADDPELAIRLAKVGFLIFIVASWLVALAAPDLVFQRNYVHGWIPALGARFWGLENSPNHMGPAALAYLLLALHQPFERRWLQHVGLLLGVAALLAAQSKTAWGAAALAIPSLLILRSRAWPAAGFSLAGLGAAVAGALLVLPMLGVSLDGLMYSQVWRDVATLSSRDDIWTLAMYEWVRNPLFGYGPTIWDSNYRMQVGMDAAVSAHNQALQTLSVAGTIGLIGLLGYLGALSLYAVRAWRGSHGLSVALLILVLARCVTEPAVAISGPVGTLFVAQLLLFHLALAYGSKREGRP
jgi:O-antigen ligase